MRRTAPKNALGKNAEAPSARASEPPSDRGMRGVSFPNTTLYLSASRGRVTIRGDKLPHIHYLWGRCGVPHPKVSPRHTPTLREITVKSNHQA